MPESYTDPTFEARLGPWIADLGESYVRPVDAVRISHAAAAGQVRRRQRLGWGALGQQAFIDRRLGWLLVAAAVALGLAAAGVASRPVAGTPYELAFVRDGDLYLAASDGSGAVRVDGGMRELGGGFRQLAWSADGALLAYVHDVPQVELKVIASDGTDQRTYRPIDAQQAAAAQQQGVLPQIGFAWGPEHQLATYSESDRAHVVILGPDGLPDRSISLPDGFRVSGAEETAFSWSPDGRRIAVNGCPAERSCGHAAKAIVMLAADGSSWHWLSDASADEQWLAWGPDAQVVAASFGGREGIAFGTADESGTQVEPLPNGMAPGPNAWRPDGSVVASMASFDGGQTLVLTRPYGAPTPIPMPPYDVIFDVQWSPDGSTILFSGAPSQGDRWSLWSIDPAAGSPRLIADGAAPFAISPMTAETPSPNPTPTLGTPRPDPSSIPVGLPSGSTIAWVRDDGVAFAASGSGAPHRILDGIDVSYAIAPIALAPDASDLAVQTADGLQIVPLQDGDVAGAAARAHVPTILGPMRFAWAPDGLTLAVQTQGDPSSLYLVDAQGARTQVLPLPRTVTVEDPSYAGVSWSRDGKWIAVSACDAPCMGSTPTGVLLVASDGSSTTWLRDTTVSLSSLPRGGSVTSVAWNVDGQVATGLTCSGQDVWCAAPSGGSIEVGTVGRRPAQRISMPDGYDAVSLAWSPDGSSLAVAAGIGGPAGPPARVYILDADGNLRQLPVDGLRFIDQIRWAPDGRELIVSADDGAGSPGLWTLEATGGSPTMIADRVVGGFDLVPTH